MKIKKIIKDNILGFIIGAILFSGVGVVLATTTVGDVWFETTKNSSVKNVEDALDDLYARADTYINPETLKYYDFVYKYWNADFDYSPQFLFDSPEDAYTTIAALETTNGAGNFANTPIYIRSAFKGNTAIYHEVCSYYATTGKEFCFAPNYWVGDSQDQIDGSTTKAKLKADMEAALGITIASGDCNSTTGYANCEVGNFYCTSTSSGYINCQSNVTYKFCDSGDDGSAGCSW